MRCYNCGIEVGKEVKNHEEHIPPQCLFNGFPESYKTNRIKVSACRACNNKYSRLDEEFRNFLGITTKNPKNNSLIESTTRSMIKNKNGKTKAHRIIYDNSSNKVIVKFRPRDLASFHIKNFKGVFYHNYSVPICDKYKIGASFLSELTNGAEEKKIISYLLNFNWKFSGNSEIFKYIIQPLRVNIPQDGKDLAPMENERWFVCLMYYNESHAVLVHAAYENKIS